MIASCATYIVGGFDLIALIDDGSTIGTGTVVGVLACIWKSSPTTVHHVYEGKYLDVLESEPC